MPDHRISMRVSLNEGRFVGGRAGNQLTFKRSFRVGSPIPGAILPRNTLMVCTSLFTLGGADDATGGG